MNQEKNKSVIKKAVFFDRDGVLNEDFGYVYKTKDLKWVAGAKESIKLLKNLGFLIIVITNQSGVFRGFYNENDVRKFHKFMNNQLKKDLGVKIDDFYYSIDDPKITEARQTRRKPSPRMILEAINKHNINKASSFLVGDKKTDILAAKNAGIQGFLFEDVNLFDRITKILKELNFNCSKI